MTTLARSRRTQALVDALGVAAVLVTSSWVAVLVRRRGAVEDAMRGYSIAEAVALESLVRTPEEVLVDGSLSDVGHRACVERGLAVETEDENFWYYDITHLGRIAARLVSLGVGT